MMRLKVAFLLGLGLLGLLLLVSCQREVERETAVITTPTIVPTSTAVPTLTASPPTATQTPVVTLTPLPTFAPDELETAVADLLANPMNCDVPCWLGAVPSQTTVFEIQQFLSLYQIEDYFIRDDDQNQIPELIELWDQFDFRVTYGFENNILTLVISRALPISTILEKYGPPDEIWLATGLERYPMPFRLNLVYLQDGMAFGYTANGDAKNNLIEGCFANLTGIMSLDVPNNINSYKDFPIIFGEDHRYLVLEEATNLTMNEFMQQFSDPAQPQCIETPIELWE